MSNQAQVSLEDALEMAKQYHQSGNLTLADRTYRDILKAVPEEFNSLHYLSIICFQTGKPQEGLEFIEKAVNINDENADSWNAYGAMLAQVGKHEEAVEKFNKAVELDPNFHETLSNLGNSLWELGRFEEAKEVCQKAVDINPEFFQAYNNLGIAIASLGDKEKAIEIWEKALTIQPRNADILINIGNVLNELGRPTEGEEYAVKALEIHEDHPKALFNLGNALRDQGKLNDSEEAYRKAVAIQPDFVDAYNNLTLLLIQMHRYEEALTSARYVIAFQPEHAVAYGYLAFTLKELGKLKEAEEAARTALKLNPDAVDSKIELAEILFLSDRYSEAETLFNDILDAVPDNYSLYVKLSGVLEKQNRIEEALETVDKAVKLSPETPDVYYRKAMILYMAGKVDESLQLLDKTLELNPNSPNVIGVKSEILQSKGEMDEALKHVKKALEMGDQTPGVYLTLSKLKKFKDKEDPDFIRMLEIVDKPFLGRGQKAGIHFALFKAYQDIGEYNEAFNHLKKGNDAKRASVIYNPHLQDVSADNVAKTFHEEYFEKLKDHGSDSEVPIFIVGMPRSGTTLTEQIISSHPDVFGAGELTYIADIETKCGIPTPENAKDMANTYLEKIRAINEEAKEAKKITDKMPGNFMKLGHIVAMFPKAKIIHCRRNPMDTGLSCYKQLFARGHYWSYNLEEMGEHYRHYREVMDYWRENLPKENYLEVDYEETVNDFENQARRLIDHVGMEWDDACLAPHKQKRSVMTASKGQVIKPIYKTSVEAWRRYEEQLDPLYQKVKDLM